MHCSVMGREALEAAIANYRGQGVAKHQQGNIICKCFGVTDEEIKRVVRENRLKTVEDVTHYTKAGGGCGGCKPLIEELIAEVAAEARAAGSQGAPGRRLTNIQKIKLIQETLEREIGPALRTDGGDIELVDVDGHRVTVALRGTCAHCIGSEATLRGYVEKKLREIVDPEIVVEEAPK
jgi:NifU-like protein